MEESKLSDFVFFWRFQHSPIVKTLNLNVWTLPLIFLRNFTLFVIDMHQNRPVSLFSTPFDHFHFHTLAELIWWVQLRSCHISSSPHRWRPHASDAVALSAFPCHSSAPSDNFQIGRKHDFSKGLLIFFGISTKIWRRQILAKIPKSTSSCSGAPARAFDVSWLVGKMFNCCLFQVGTPWHNYCQGKVCLVLHLLLWDTCQRRGLEIDVTAAS